jgi:hypothetical protein
MECRNRDHLPVAPPQVPGVTVSAAHVAAHLVTDGLSIIRDRADSLVRLLGRNDEAERAA